MHLKIPCILLMLVGVQGDVDYVDDDGSFDEDYEGYSEDGEATTATTSIDGSTVNRVKRYEESSALKTLSAEDVREVRGALKQLFSGITLENPFTPYTTTALTTPDYLYTATSVISSITSTYDTLTTNTTNTITSTYLSDLLTEILQFTDSEPTKPIYFRQNNNKSTTPRASSNITNKNVPLLTTKKPELDIPRLLAIISDLASEFESNLTRKLKDTLITMTLPTCSTPLPEPPITSEYDANYTGSVIAKCFVCGLTIPEIPHHAHCADAFAGDFLPLVPVDPTSKGKISRFRKYCQYSNIPGYELNETQPRVILGRWTGGCAVRWIDLSGVYTQRTCRNRLQPTMGKHFASKRMAKLERTLWNIENGCIISPMATLVPLSRGISLYARFHACVCTGSWCNTAALSERWTTNTLLILLLSIT